MRPIHPQQFHGNDASRPYRRRDRASCPQAVSADTGYRKMIVWGNHSGTQYPDPGPSGTPRPSGPVLLAHQEWVEHEFIPTVQKCGAAVIDARACPARRARPMRPFSHRHDWMLSSHHNDWVTMKCPVRWQLWHSGGRDLWLPGHLQKRPLHTVLGLPISALGHKHMEESYKGTA